MPPTQSNPRLLYGFGIVLVLAAVALLLYLTVFRSGTLPVKMNSPAFSLTDLNGETVTEARYADKVRVVSFIFTRCPDICPVTTSNMVQMQKKLKERGLFGSEVEFVSISFDPDNDTPEVLQQYADRLGVDPSGWTFLRGEEAQVKQLAAGYNISILKIDEGSFAHSVTSLLLIDGKQQVRSIYKMGEEMSNDQILDDIYTLVEEQRAS